MKRIWIVFFVVGLSLTMYGNNALADLSVDTLPGITYEVDAIAIWDTLAEDMAGVSVTASFSSGQNDDILSWGDLGSGLFGVQTSEWSLTMNGSESTFYAIWTLDIIDTSNVVISDIVISGLSGDIVFDIVPPFDVVTDGSEYGREIIAGSLTSGNLSIEAVYSNEVALTGNAALLDLYETLSISFLNDGGFTSDSIFYFKADTDNIGEVPEPGTMLLFGSGILGISSVLVRRRKEKN